MVSNLAIIYELWKKNYLLLSIFINFTTITIFTIYFAFYDYIETIIKYEKSFLRESELQETSQGRQGNIFLEEGSATTKMCGGIFTGGYKLKRKFGLLFRPYILSPLASCLKQLCDTMFNLVFHSSEGQLNEFLEINGLG